jgi:hypothetical protein
VNKPINWKLAKLLMAEGFDLQPTIGDAVAWVYEKFGFWIEVVHRKGFWGFSINNVEKGWFELERFEYKDLCEAYEEALKESLIIHKQNLERELKES